jgi:hypothetical protein
LVLGLAILLPSLMQNQARAALLLKAIAAAKIADANAVVLDNGVTPFVGGLAGEPGWLASIFLKR